MKRIAFAVMLSFVAAGAAFAADLPQAPPPPPRAPAVYAPAPPVYNWGGVYVGINGGWGFGTAKYTVPPIAGVPLGVTGSVNDSGGVVGGTLGVNFQTGAFVFGVEGDFDYSGINTGTTSTICVLVGTCQTGNNWLSTLRGRVGFAWDRVLFYGTGGGVFGNAQTTVNGVSTTHTQAGWTAGLGVEVALAENWTAKVEYLYANLGTGTAPGTCSTAACLAANGGAPVPFIASAGLTDSLVRVGINYKFNF